MSDILDRLSEALSDRYRIVSELGEGGMAIVFLADDLKHKRRVAIKVLKPELAAVVGKDRFFAEIETTAQLQHHVKPPNVLISSGEPLIADFGIALEVIDLPRRLEEALAGRRPMIGGESASPRDRSA